MVDNSTDILLHERDDNGILRLILNDVGRRNALSEAMLTQLTEAISKASDDKDVRVVILAAKGPAFCAGHDLKEMTAGRKASDRGRDYFTKIMAMCSTLMQTIVNCSKPVIAEVTGCLLYTSDAADE